MSKHKVKRYDGEEGSEVSAEDEAAMDAAGRFVESGPKTMTMPRRPVSRTPVASAAPSRMSGPGRKPTGPAAAAAPEARDRFGIPTSMGSAGKSYAPTGKAAESASGSELGRNLEAAGNATGASAAIQGVRRGAAIGKGLAEFAAGRKAAPAVAKAAEKAAPTVSTKRAAPNPKIMEEVNEGLKAHKAKLAAKEALKPRARPKAEIKRDAISRADTLDEFGGAMKRGGSVKRYASGGSVGSFRSSANGIAQRGKTRGKMC